MGGLERRFGEKMKQSRKLAEDMANKMVLIDQGITILWISSVSTTQGRYGCKCLLWVSKQQARSRSFKCAYNRYNYPPRAKEGYVVSLV